jgi:hypothetical protein
MAKKSNGRKRSNANGNARDSSGLFEDILAIAGALTRQTKDHAAQKLEKFAESTRGVAEAMPDMPQFRGYLAATANGMEELADYVMESDLQTMAEDANAFARAHPVTTLAGTIVAGALSSQLLMSRLGASQQSRGKPAGRERAAARGRAHA